MNLPKMEGEWVSAKNNYEKAFSDVIGATAEISVKYKRYWDCIWNGVHIELKKGKVWLDLVRYSEYLLRIPPHDKLEVITLFLIRDKSYKTNPAKIVRIYGCTTNRIVEALHLDEFSAQQIIRVNDSVPRSLNAQASLQEVDIQKVALFCISDKSANSINAQTSLFDGRETPTLNR